MSIGVVVLDERSSMRVGLKWLLGGGRRSHIVGLGFRLGFDFDHRRCFWVNLRRGDGFARDLSGLGSRNFQMLRRLRLPSFSGFDPGGFWSDHRSRL